MLSRISENMPDAADLKRSWTTVRTVMEEKARLALSRLAHAADVWRAALAEEQSRPDDKLRDHELEFLPAAVEVLETPPSPAGRTVLYLILTLITVTIAWSWFGMIDTEAVAEGKIIPGGRVKVIQPLEIGVVRKIHITEGQRVGQGDLLIELDPTESGSDRERLQRELLAARLDVVRYRAMAKNEKNPEDGFSQFPGDKAKLVEATLALLHGRVAEHHAQLAAHDGEVTKRSAEVAKVNAAIAKLEETVPLLEERVNVLESLSKKKFAKRSDYLELKQQLVESKGDLEIERRRKQEMKAGLVTIIRKRAELAAKFRADATQEMVQSLHKVAAVEQELRKAEERLRQRRLVAPADGVVHSLAVNTVGGVVAPTEPLMLIVPDDSPLEIEAKVLNKDIGFVEAGQKVQVKIESFPFTRYGLIEGEVLWVSADAVQDEKLGAVFNARVAMHQDKILVDDRWVKLGPGMAVTVEVKTGERRAIEFFLAPFLRYQDEALMER